MKTKRPTPLLAVLTLLFGSAFHHANAQQAPKQELPAPLLAGMGDHHHAVTTGSGLAQRYFNQGMALLYGFNHKEAIRSFTAAAQADPKCAMAWWGVAYAHGPNINAPMSNEAVPKAWEALQQALNLKSGVSPREQAYIDALAKRCRPDPMEDRAALDLAYADAMKEVAAQYPDDLDAATLHAEALMDTMPWNYWNKDRTPKPATEVVISTLRSVLRRNPQHPGANHLYIHAVEAGPHPEEGLPSADRLGGLVPGAGHLVHMPSHIYVRVGQYHDATLANRKAVAADESYIAQCRAQGFYPGMYYPHNVHFLWFATSLEGRSAESLDAARKVAKYALDARCGAAEIIEAPRFRHLPLLVLARFGRWQEILNEGELPADQAFDRAMWHYARGLAFLETGKIPEAARESKALANILKSGRIKPFDTDYLPATGIITIANHVLAGKLAGKKGDVTGMIRELETAVREQDELSYMEPPYWYYPVRQSLGAALLRTSDFSRAEKVFREDLEDFPRNGWSLFGLLQSLDRQGRTDAAARVELELNKAWQNADTRLDLSWF